jgi:Big-like domain-containing protein
MSRAVVPGLLAVAACFGGTETSPVGEIPPPPPPPSISVSMGPEDATIAVGASLQYQAVSTSTVAGWEWSLSNTARASISPGGSLVALQPGALRVQACATNAPNVCGVADLTIEAVPPGGAPTVSVLPATTHIAVGQSVEFTARAVNFAEPSWAWSSMDQLTATISPTGTLTGRRPGLAVVAACAPSAPRYCGTARVQVQ